MPSANDIYFFYVEGIPNFVRGKIENCEDGFYLLSGVRFVNSEGLERNSLKSKDGMFYLSMSKIIYFFRPNIEDP